MALGEGADQLGGDLGADRRARGDAERLLQHGDVEAGEMHDPGDVRVRHEAREVGRVIAAAAQSLGQQLHEVCDPVARRQLHEAEAVAMRVQAHRLGIDRDG